MSGFRIQKLKGVLKEQLKRRKISYQDLAAQLECSVPTVKRILGQEELTLSRLLEILQVLELTLSDLELLAAKSEVEERAFTPPQEEFLAANQNYFAYLMQIYSGLTPKQIADKFDLDSRSTDKYLLHLEKHALIRVTGRQKVKPAHTTMPHLGSGKLAKMYFKSVITTAATFFIRNVEERLYTQRTEGFPSNSIPKGFELRQVKVTPETYRRFVEEYRRQMGEFIKVAGYEEKTRPAEDLQTAVVLQAVALVANDHKHLEDLGNVFGQVIPI